MAQIVQGRPGIGAAFGTGISSGLSTLADAKIKEMIEGPRNKAFADAFLELAGQQDQQGELQQAPQQAPAPSTQRPNQNQPGIQAQALKQPGGLTPKTIEGLKKYGLKQDQIEKLVQLDQQRKLRQATLSKEARKEEIAHQKDINKRTQPFYDKIIEGEKSAKQVKHRLNKLKELDAKGKLPPAALYNALSALESIGTKEGSAIGAAIGGALGTGAGASIGGPVGAAFGLTEGTAKGAAIGAGLGAAIKPVTSLLRSALIGAYPDTEEFEKTSLEFIKDVRPLIGGHVTENQLDLFLRSIPTLATTAEGRKTIINNMGILAEGATAEYDALEEIIESNGSKRPDGLEFKVGKLADEKRKEYAKRWKS